MEDSGYIVGIGLLGLVFFVTAVIALFWASKHGQLRNFENGARSIFDEEEPEGEFGDAFPGKRNVKESKSASDERNDTAPQ